MIEVKQLTRKFDDFTAVDALSFTVNPGEVLGFLGPNGAGKSTTMKMITGFLAPTSGDISVYGHSIDQEALTVKKMIGYLPEGAPAYGEMTVMDFLSFIAEARGINKEQQLQAISRVVAEVGLQDVLHKPIETLSKGYKRRVGLAQAIIHQPKILILDEPTDGLDPNQKHQVRQLIQNMAKDKIIIISTHILEEVTAVCSRAMIIAHGKKVIDGTPEELMRQSRYHGAVTVSLKGVAATSAHLQQLKQQDWVAEIEIREMATATEAEDPEHDHLISLTVIPSHKQEIIDQVKDWFAEQKITLTECFVDKGSLDDVFRDVTKAPQDDYSSMAKASIQEVNS